ncbi:putative deacetoxyvindoline 4-hydroxylase [Rosa chinensis]|uniref:Putative deacetoxyvindoline 4-hydroxylase n=1 Tax=Rosa chinensis TaxID=74649 RepID=A0A2P6QE92_ROSCH|nr:putative deacetoxyvindoline 4-hydroxylase [Rosa chinensis]
MSRHAEVIDGVRRATESVGLFQVVNHGIPKRVLEEMLQAMRGFHELPKEVKAEYYSTDPRGRPGLLVCRDITMEYSKYGHKLGVTLFELLSEGLGLKPDHLIGMDCAKGHLIAGHYYPPCPEPQLTIGGGKHTYVTFLSMLLQDNVNALQLLYQNQWTDVLPMSGAIVVNIGDYLQASNIVLYTFGVVYST